MTPTPTAPLTGRDINVAAIATRGVLDKTLADVGTPFTQWVIVNRLADEGGEEPRDAAIGAIVLNLRLSDVEAAAALDATSDAGLIAGDATVGLTDAGRALVDRVRSTVSAGTQRIFADIPVEDLLTARRVLETVTERARAELALPAG